MPLSASLPFADLTFECPFCNCLLVRLAFGFSRFIASNAKGAKARYG